MPTDLENKVMLINLNISCFTGEKVDRTVSDDVASKHNTTAHDAGRYSKQIISKHSLEAIRKISSAARSAHADRTLPWDNTGGRILSVVGYMDYSLHLANLHSLFRQEVDNFLDIYPKLIQQARQRLNGLFNVDDYPDISTLRARFSFKTNATPLPSSKNWFLQLADDTMAELRSEADARLSENIDLAVKDTYRRVATVTEAMATKLRAYDPEATNKADKGIFRDSLVENVREVTSLIPSLNITDSEQLAHIAELMRNELCVLNADELRVNSSAREQVANSASSIYDRLKGFY
jgi:hypothetical protein